MIRFIGANPGLTIIRNARRVAFASIWRADWSEQGSGWAIVLWYKGQTHVVTTNHDLGRWLAQDFTRHFPEVAGLPWPQPAIETGEIAVTWDLAHGVTARGGGITIELGPPVDRRLIQAGGFDLGGVKHHLSMVYMPCANAILKLDGVQVDGLEKGFIADAGVWSTIPSGP